MRHLSVYTVLLSFLACAAPETCAAGGNATRAQDARRLDGESLPEGALFRLGKYHFQHFGAIPFIHARDGTHLLTVSGWERTMKTWDVVRGRPVAESSLPNVGYAFAISPDGKMLASSSCNSMLYVWSAENGAPLSEIDKPGAWQVAFSEDGTKILDISRTGVVRTIDIASKKTIRRTVLDNLPKNLTDDDSEMAYSAVFSRDGKTVAALFGDEDIRLWDVASGKELHRLKEPKRKTRLLNRPLKFSRDGKFLATVGPPFTVCWWEVASARKLRSFRLASDVPETEDTGDLVHKHLLAYSPDGKYLAAYADGLDEIKVWEPATGKEAASFPILSNSLDCLSFSEDGKTVVGVGDGAIVVWDIATGRLLGYPEGKTERHEDLCFFPDGRRAYTRSFRIQSASPDRRMPSLVKETVVWEVATGKKLYAAPGRPLGHSPDGKYLVTGPTDDSYGSDRLSTGTDPFRFYELAGPLTPEPQNDRSSRLFLVAAETGKVLHHLPAGEALFSNNGRSLAVCSEGTVQVVDCATGKVVRSGKFDRDLRVLWGSADLSRFLVWDQKTIRLLDLAQGKELWRRPLPAAGFTEARKNVKAIESARISADEKVCAAVFPDRIEAWDMRTGKDIWRCPAPPKWEVTFLDGFSPDGRFLCRKCAKDVAVIDLDSGEEVWRVPWRDLENRNLPWVGAFLRDNLLRVTDGDQVGLWRGNGRLLRRFDYSGDPGMLVASPDGKFLAGPGKGGKIFVWEIATGLLLQSFTSPEGAVSLTYAPDGKTLVSHGEHITLVWDLTGLKLSTLNRPLPLAAGDFDRCWCDFAQSDGKRFHKAFWRMAADPQQTVARLGDLLRPARQAKSRKIDQLIRDLGDDTFAVREQASQALEDEDSATPLLYQRLKQDLSLDEKNRIQRILGKPRDLNRTPSDLRLYRSIQVLEQIGTRDAIHVLRKLADGTPGAMVTQEARASLERMAR